MLHKQGGYPMQHATYFLSQTQYDWLAGQLPEPVSKTKHVIPNRELLNGVLFVLKTGCRWQDIPASTCSHGFVSCWRRLNFWRKKGAIKGTWQQVLVLLDKQGELDLSVGNLDGSLVQSPKFQGTGYNKRHHRNGTNISLLTEKNGLPLTNMTTKGNRHDVVSAEATVRKLRVGAKRRIAELNADKGYDSKTLRRNLRKRGIAANIPERQFKHRWKRGRKPLYDKVTAKLRAFVERTNAWLKYYRKLRYRWDRKKSMFQAHVDLACLCICLRRMEI
jgi:transposase